MQAAAESGYAVGCSPLSRLSFVAVSEENYSSGDDYVVEFQEYQFGFNAADFEQRVTAAAVRLGLIGGNELDEDEVADLVQLTEKGWITDPQSALGRYLVRHWETISLVEGESLVDWLRRLVFRGAWLDHRVKQELLEVAWEDDRRGLHVPRSARRPRLLDAGVDPELARAPVPPVRLAAGIAAYLAALLAVDTQVSLGPQLGLGVLTWLVLRRC